ncbi:uncharacterized protein LOC128867202 [Anastrepha ludens]|uniref:uncharacterized protein LOC128867202 n=1 Tax=Anastrepha ludens TaxID=28586 RepID=UPI0023B1E7E4|nr:uncharacterized protein LOC128867202 [Anastrepha ludens]
MNRNYAYVVTEDQWNFLNRQQRILIQPFFHLSKICFGTVFKAIPIQRDAIWLDTFNLFTLITRESGLWGQWEERAFNEAVRSKYAQILTDTYPVEPLNLRFFTIAWIVLASGLLLSFCVFLLEYYVDKHFGNQEVGYNRFIYE